MPAHKTPRVQKTCIICQKPFECLQSKANVLVTCGSKECKKARLTGENNPFYGHKHTEEAKAKVSHANKKPYIEVVCTCGCGQTMEYPLHRITKNKTDTYFVNQEHLHRWLEGENHWNYKGGNIYYGDGWTKIAQTIRERDKVCQHCGKTPEQNGRELDVHHISPVRVSRDNSPENLIALCKSCHQKLQTSEQISHPYKVSKYRKCIACNKVFIPEPFQKFCSDECRRVRTRQWKKKHLDTHPEAYQKRRQRIKNWQQANKDRVNESHQQSRLRRRLKDSH